MELFGDHYSFSIFSLPNNNPDYDLSVERKAAEERTGKLSARKKTMPSAASGLSLSSG